MSLKRLLDPSDNLDHIYSDHQPKIGWDDYGVSIDADPIVRDQSWPSYVDELLGQYTIQEGLSQDYNGTSFDPGPLIYAQEQIEQWAAANIPWQTSSATPTSESEVQQTCYGMIYRASVRLRGHMEELDSKLSTGDIYSPEGYFKMAIAKVEGQFVVTFPDGTVMGEVNTQLEKALDSIPEQQQIDFEVLAPIKPIREKISEATKEKDAIVRVNINVYGPRNVAHQIGSEFSQHKVYLQQPDHMRNGSTYDNPHILKIPNFQSSYKECIVPSENEKETEARKVEEFKKTISDVYSSLTRGQKLVGLEGDARLKTTLLQHQKQALDFMTQRESGPIPQEFCLWRPSEIEGKPCYQHVITNANSRLPQTEIGGGILADEMGMGKSLSILALILRTLEGAHEWASKFGETTNETIVRQNSRHRTRATLIIASSDLMINEWFQEIDKHFHHQVSGALKTIKYHGRNRETDLSRLCDVDLIITTYHTLASDFAGHKNPLNQIEWYRLVLDEAHIIRRQSTGLYRTVAELKARSRWCLTGTPIQNRLEDIGSLFAFIRVNPFHNLSAFRKFISLPFEEGGKRRQIAIERFTRLLDCICLRRTKDLLHLPDQHDRVRMIDFIPEERMQYEQTKKMMIRAVHNQVGILDHKSTLGVFQVQLQLRILCNHGTYQQPFSWHRRKLHLQDEREAMESSLAGDAEATCSGCQQTMPVFSSGSMFRRYTDHCKHVLCFECIEESTPKNLDQGTSSVMTKCPLCPSILRSSQVQHSTQPGDIDLYFRSEGHSSKMMTLMNDVQVDLWSTKSIIFSCWTRTLDLIKYYLQRYSIQFQRIDGECSTAKREKILEDFAKNPRLRVLIMTTGTGAVGLNLATANRVFIVEPQWNPSVENQAIARALRLGQEQSVQVTRYLVNGTVEQEMRSLQDRKLKTAGIAWE